MARGISEDDVWGACDALLLAGARPTIERVRQQIGRGSPNTVSTHLDTWFKSLGSRIKDPGAFAAPPQLPDPIHQAAKHFWEVAQAEARHDHDQQLKEGLAAAESNVDAAKNRAAAAEAAALEASEKAERLQADLIQAEEVIDQEKLVRVAAEAHLVDARRQIDELMNRLSATQAELDRVREEAKQETSIAADRAAAAERTAALAIKSERSSQARLERKAELQERRLEAAHNETRSALMLQVETVARLEEELKRVNLIAGGSAQREHDLRQELSQMSAATAKAERDAHAARAQAELAERVISDFGQHDRSRGRSGGGRGKATAD